MTNLLSPILEVRDIQKSFDHRVIHNQVSFTVYQNEILGLMGASGTGKSLLLKSIVGLEKPDSGSIFFEGVNLTHLTETEFISIRKKVGYVFQSGALFDSLTVYENLAYPLEKHTTLTASETREKILERLAIFNLESAIHLFPSELSGGMQKRIGLLRATILDPALILFDEPAAGLDPVNIRRLIQNIKKIKSLRNLTGIFVSHDFQIVSAICDRIAIFKNGTIYAIEAIETIRHSEDPIIREFTDNNYDHTPSE